MRRKNYIQIQKIAGRSINNAQDEQDKIFAGMSPDRKIELTAQLTSLCLELNRLNAHNRPKKTTGKVSLRFR